MAWQEPDTISILLQFLPKGELLVNYNNLIPFRTCPKRNSWLIVTEPRTMVSIEARSPPSVPLQSTSPRRHSNPHSQFHRRKSVRSWSLSSRKISPSPRIPHPKKGLDAIKDTFRIKDWTPTHRELPEIILVEGGSCVHGVSGILQHLNRWRLYVDYKWLQLWCP